MKTIILILLVVASLGFSTNFTASQTQCMKTCCDNANGTFYPDYAVCHTNTTDVSDCFSKCTDEGSSCLPAALLPLIVLAALK